MAEREREATTRRHSRWRNAGMPVAIWIVAIVAAIFLLEAASQLLIPIVLAVVISYALEPVVAWLARHHVPRTLGAALLLVVIVVASGQLAYNLRDDAIAALEAVPAAAERVRDAIWSDGNSPARQVREAASALQGVSSGESGDGWCGACSPACSTPFPTSGR